MLHVHLSLCSSFKQGGCFFGITVAKKKAQKVTQQSLVLVSLEINLNTVGLLGTALVWALHC